MAFSGQDVKTPRGYGRSGVDYFLDHQSQTVTTFHDDKGFMPAPWLPVQLQETKTSNEWYTILAGSIVGLTTQGVSARKPELNGVTINLDRYLVPANGGDASIPIVYTSDDIGYTDDISVTGATHTAVTSAVDTGINFDANFPIGWVRQHLFGSQIQLLRKNYQQQYTTTEVMTDGFVEYALWSNTHDNLATGRHVCATWEDTTPRRGGVPRLWVNGTDSVDQIAGRVIHIRQVGTGSNSPGRLDLVKTVGGLDLPGLDTDGRPRHLDVYRVGSGGVSTTEKVTHVAFIRVKF